MHLIPFVQYHKNENKYKLRFLLVLFLLFFLFKLQPFAFVGNRTPGLWVPVICSFVHTEAIELSGALLLMSTEAGS